MYKAIIGAIIIYLALGLQVAFGQTSLLASLQPVGWVAIALWMKRGEDREWVTIVYTLVLSSLYGLLVNANLGLIALSLALTIVCWQMMQRIINLQMQNLGQILVFFNIWQLLWLLLAHVEFSAGNYLSFVIVNSVCAYAVTVLMQILNSRVAHGSVRLR